MVDSQYRAGAHYYQVFADARIAFEAGGAAGVLVFLQPVRPVGSRPGSSGGYRSEDREAPWAAGLVRNCAPGNGFCDSPRYV